MLINKKIKEYLLITIGIIFVAIAVEYFFVPNNLAAGGMMGIAIVLNAIFPRLGVSEVTLFLNIVLLVVSFIILGGEFGKKTIFASIGLSVLMWIIEKFFNPFAITNDLILATIFGTLLSAIGMAIIFNYNSSTGGSDIIAKIMNEFLHINIGTSLLIIDILITFSAIIVFGVNIGLYSMLSVIILGITIDKLIDGFNSCKEVLIMSSKEDEISDYIMRELSRGCTFLNGVGGFTGKDLRVIYAILERREYIRLKGFILEIDPSAFISVRESHEVLGEGFREMS